MATRINRHARVAGIVARSTADQPLVGGIYARISRDEDQERLGVQRQEEDGRADLARRNIPVYRVYEDNDLSGSGDEERPDFDGLVADLRLGVINTVWSFDVDRLVRGHSEYIEFYEACEKIGALVIWHGGAANFAAGTGLLELEMRAAFAREELRKIKQRTARAFDQMARKGNLHRGGGDAYGFRPVKSPEGHVINLEVVEHEAEVIREMAKRVLAGEPTMSICRDLDARGERTAKGRRWTPSHIKRVLTGVTISGRRVHKGEIVAKGWWPAIIDPHTSDRLRALLLHPTSSAQRANIRHHLLSGIAVCGLCGTRMAVESRGEAYADARGEVTPTRVYACRKSPGYYGCGRIKVNADRLERTVIERLLGLEASGTLRSILYADRIANLHDAERELDTVRAELKELAYQRTSGKLMPEEVEGTRDALLERRERAEKVIAAAQRAIGLPNLPDPLAPAWGDLELHERRTILKATLLAVKVMPAPARGPGFDPSRVVTEWKG